MIVEVFVAQRQPMHPLPQQLFERVVRPAGISPVNKALGQALREAQVPIGLAQQQDSSITGKGSSRKISHHFSSSQILKEQRLVRTVCSGSGELVRIDLASIHQPFRRRIATAIHPLVKYPGEAVEASIIAASTRLKRGVNEIVITEHRI